ncbi:hypothetical protein D3C86_1662990 [compost metagenome]
MQQIIVKWRIAFEVHGPQVIARAALVHQFDIGNAGLRVDRQALACKAAAEKAIARGLILDQALGIFVMPVVEHCTAAQPRAVRLSKRLEFTGRPFDPDRDIAQVHRLTRVDREDQPG